MRVDKAQAIIDQVVDTVDAEIERVVHCSDRGTRTVKVQLGVEHAVHSDQFFKHRPARCQYFRPTGSSRVPG